MSDVITRPAAAPVPEGVPLPAGLDTPTLVVDLDRAEANARRLGDGAAARGVAIRPHIKTHKSVALARLQQIELEADESVEFSTAPDRDARDDWLVGAAAALRVGDREDGLRQKRAEE